ncbi:MAG TPA: RNase P subunit p30 family protein [Candidatus Nanoarchaeia archaeon]|nr:RNase P subunit p30 family protein [Candidatus Nanoarchaeia archaeon]
MIDVVFPGGNPSAFLAAARRLGFQDIAAVGGQREDGVVPAVLCSPKDVMKSRRAGALVLVMHSAEDRFAIEKARPDLIFGLEQQPKDFMHSRNSGLDQVLCTLAAKNQVAVGFDFGSVLRADDVERSRLMGRMMQNIRLCRKYRVAMVLGSFARSPGEMRACHDLMSFGISLGMHPQEAKQSLKYLESRGRG